MKTNESQAKETLFDLLIGITCHFILLLTIGNIFIKNDIFYSLGLAMGCVTGMLLAVSIYSSLKTALELGEEEAERYIRKKANLRMFIMAVVTFMGIKMSMVSFIGIIIGILGLKISAFFQPYTNSYITKKIFKKKER